MGYFPARKGFVYFAKHSRKDVVKIGFSDRPHVRVRELALDGRYGLFQLLGSIPGTGRLEMTMHRRFADALLNLPDGREFFRYSQIAGSIRALLAKAA